MLKEGRPGLTDTQQAEMWQRWKAGQSTDEICHALGRKWSSVLEQLSLSGGLQPRVRRRAARALTFAEREEGNGGLSSRDIYASSAFPRMQLNARSAVKYAQG
jgi:hypothetical protein